MFQYRDNNSDINANVVNKHYTEKHKPKKIHMTQTL